MVEKLPFREQSVGAYIRHTKEGDAPVFSRSDLMSYGLSDIHGLARQLSTSNNETSATVVGSAAHALILEPDAFEERYAIEPGQDVVNPLKVRRRGEEPTRLKNYRNGTEYKQWKASAESSGKVPLTSQEWDKVREMSQAGKTHPAIGELLAAPGIIERTLLWPEHVGDSQAFGKVRPDKVIEITNNILPLLKRLGMDCADAHVLVLDVKTSYETADADSFTRRSASTGVAYQAAWYRRAFREYGLTARVLFVQFESASPYAAAMYECDLFDTDAAESRLLACLEEGVRARRAHESGEPLRHLNDGRIVTVRPRLDDSLSPMDELDFEE